MTTNEYVGGVLKYTIYKNRSNDVHIEKSVCDNAYGYTKKTNAVLFRF